jgi:hypothetical protein
MSKPTVPPRSLPTGGAAPAQKKKRPADTIADIIAELDKMQITAQWIKDEFLSPRLGTKLSSQQKNPKTKKSNIFFCWLSACCEEPKSGEQSEPLSELSEETKQFAMEQSKKLHGRLTDHAIFTHKQLEEVAMQTGGVALLYKILKCKGAAEAISKYYDNHQALKESLAPKRDSIFLALTGELEKMDAFLMNYGLAAALVAATSMTNFGSITKADWLAYLPLALRDQACQAKAKELCGDEALSPDHLGWAPLYCQAAVDLLIATPHLDLMDTSTYPVHPIYPDLSCCIEALECAKKSKWNLECAYTIGCAGASASMLLVVLFSAWLYIALHASSANRERFEEANLLRERFKDEFVIVHALFFIGVILGFIGVIATFSLKVATLALSWTAWGITVFAGFLAIFLFVKCPLEVYRLNQAIDEEREFKKKELADHYKTVLEAARSSKAQTAELIA